MKRTSSAEIAFDAKRFESSTASMSQQQQQQLQQNQAMRPPIPPMVQQFQAQQDRQFQEQQRIQVQQQQQYAASQQYYAQSAYFPMNQISYPAYPAAVSPQWGFMTTPPPPYFEMPPLPPAGSVQPPLPPPELKPEKPPLPKDPEPELKVNESGSGTNASARNSNGTFADGRSWNNGMGANVGSKTNRMGTDNESASATYIPPRNYNGMCGQRAFGLSATPPRMRGSNGVNANVFNGFNRGVWGGPMGIRPQMHANANQTSNRGRGRRSGNAFSQMKTSSPSSTGLTRFPNDLNDLGSSLDDDIPAGPEKMTIFLNNSDGAAKVQINKKPKRKPMSSRYARTTLWRKEDAEAVLALERECNQSQKRKMLILKFPDPDLNKYIVRKYSPAIDIVHFQQPSTPRYCFVQLKEGSDVDKVLATLRETPFGTGKINAELKNQHPEDQQVSPDEIDPYTLYIGNLPSHISVRVVKEYFPNAQRIDIGYAQRMRFTRYAFIRYNSVAEAMSAYRNTVHSLLESRSLIVRFRRQKGNIGLPGESKPMSFVTEDRDILPDLEPKILECSEEANDDDAETYEENDDVSEIETEPQEDSQKLSNTNKAAEENSNDQVHVNDVENPCEKSKSVMPEPVIDSKDGVLEKANELIERAKKTADIAEPICSSVDDRMQSSNVEGDVKLEYSDEDSSDDGGVNLLGTRVKDEPYVDHNRPPTPSLDDIYLDDYEYDEYDDEPEEEDDEWATPTIFSTAPPDWNEFRRNELNARENKPDLSTLDALPDVPQIPADIVPKEEIDELFGPTRKKKARHMMSEEDDLQDMFAQMNSDTECEDENALFR